MATKDQKRFMNQILPETAMARSGSVDLERARKRQIDGFAAETWLRRTMFPSATVLRRKSPGDLRLASGEIVEVKSVPFAGAQFVNGGDKAPKYRTIVVVTDGDEDEWFVLGQIGTKAWRWGRPKWVEKAVACWYVPISEVGCVDEWRCDHA